MGYAQILSSGPGCSIQDAGRYGYRHLGVPVSGPMDNLLFEAANYLAGNEEICAALEIFNVPFVLRFSAPCVLGYGGQAGDTDINGFRQNHGTLKINSGDVVTVHRSLGVNWRYLSINGGWLTKSLLGSRSSLSAIGLMPPGKAVVLPYLAGFDEDYEQSSDMVVRHIQIEIQVKPGPDFDDFDAAELSRALETKYTLDPNSNRMAYGFMERLEVFGFKRSIENYHSAPVFPGIIQLTPSGKFFVIMKDGQSTGGYPRPLQIEEPYLSVFAQLPFGNKVRFHLKK
ncbi:MAG: hypothetical protein IPN29_16265 [Saprospiraceae bacterium]|nr:hypothetical protein [Saprospiraceae bacterium]